MGEYGGSLGLVAGGRGVVGTCVRFESFEVGEADAAFAFVVVGDMLQDFDGFVVPATVKQEFRGFLKAED